MTAADLDKLAPANAEEKMLRCCGSARWAAAMVGRRPFSTREGLLEAAGASFEAMNESDWLEAFQHHPKLGDRKSLEKKFGQTAKWASGEQSGAATASPAVLEALAEQNEKYYAKFGFIFILCATGKAAAEMLEALGRRIGNDKAAELRLAATEQKKITFIRLEKLLS